MQRALGFCVQTFDWYVSGRIIPRKQEMDQIFKVTGREVTTNDFYARPAPMMRVP